MQVINAQILSGRIVNTQNEPIIGASIKVIGENTGGVTNVEGRFRLLLSASKKYELEITAIGYTTKIISDIEKTNGSFNDLNITLETKTAVMEGVVVSTKRVSAKMETVASAIQFQKNTNTVASVVSAETIKRSPDKNTGEVLKRTPGASIIEGKYLVIRGLADRYNQTMLNGVLMSSTEADRKTFSFDILPSNMIDNIIINKAFVPELPGEWAGGLVQVNSKDIPSKNFFNVQIGSGINSQTIGKDFYAYKGGKLDFLGVDDGTRALPQGFPTKTVFENSNDGEKNKWGTQLSNTWATNKIAMPINVVAGVNGGFNKNIGKNSKLGSVLALTYNKTNRIINFENRVLRFQNDIPDMYFDNNNNKYAQDILAGALANFTLQIGNNHKISWKNLLNINTTDYTTIRNGKDYEGRYEGIADNTRATELAFKANTFFNTLLSGDHNIKALGVKYHWFGSFNILDQYIPDQRRISYVQSDPRVANSPYIIYIPVSNSSQKNGSRYFGFLNDYIYTIGTDVAKSFKLFGLNQIIKGGYFFQVKDRLFDARPFTIYNPSGSSQFQNLPQDKVFAPENFGNGTDNKLYFNELGPGENYRYMANSILNAGFIQFDNQLTSKLRTVWGVRVEDFDQVVGSMRKSDSRHVHTRVTDFLPGINITYKIDNKTNIRLSGSQTIIRPEFRELSRFQFYDFEMNAIIAGNPNLKRTKATNVDLRYELYPRAGETFSVGLFYKYFQLPLEAYFNPASGDGSTYNLLNAEKAKSYGVEVELRKKLDVLDALKNFTLQSNFSYIYNRVKDIHSKIDRPMQGQSPYLINLGLQYDLEKYGVNTTLLFKQIGRRIIFVGGSDQPPIWEHPRPFLDFQIAKKLFNKKGEIKLNISDILNKGAIFYYDLDENKKYNAEKDPFAIKRKYGTNFSITLGYSL